MASPPSSSPSLSAIAMDFSGCRDDRSLGPAVQGCRGDFDFTIKFEQLFMAILPPAIFMPIVLPRLVYLWRQPVIVAGSLLRAVKLLLIAGLAGIQLGLVAVSASHPGRFRALFVSASALGFAASLCMLALSSLEHGRAPRPSIILTGYLALTVLFDITQTRTLWLAHSLSSAPETTYCRLFSAAVAAKAVLAVVESVQKRTLMRARWDASMHSPEETSGLFGLGAFVWVNSLFWTGYRNVLALDDLFALDASMTTEALQVRLARYARADGYSFGGKKNGLAVAMAKTLAVPLLLPVAPRIALLGFQFCQPFLVNSALEYLQIPAGESPKNHGYGLIGATIIIYLGTAMSGALYWYLQERAMFMARGVLAGAVYRKTTEARTNTADDAAAVTLMSTDVERIRVGFLQLHEFWASTIQVAVACFLLYRQLGNGFAAPLVVVVVCAFFTGVVTSFTGTAQRVWMAHIQKRVGMTANTIAHMKHLKISGLARPVEAIIQLLRQEELSMGARFRLILCISATISYAPQMLSPVFAFVATGRSLDVTTVFTSLSYIMLVSTPLVAILQSVPTVIASLTCLARIQTFLEQDGRVDFREPITAPGEKKSQSPSPGQTAIAVSDAQFGWEPEKAALRNIDLAIPSAKLTIVVGPVASGKSTLCQALLGETPEHAGRLRVDLLAATGRFRHIGYCDQTPYLSNTSLRNNIIGLPVTARPDGTFGDVADFDERRYQEAVDAAVLRPDLALLPQGDLTNVGSNGITLSGGQKQRVSIARALYADTDLCIFDDILSGLDADTEEQVFRRVFGPEGVLARRGTTVVLCTHSVRHLTAADHVVALAPDGSIVEQGSFESLLANRKYVHGLGVKIHEVDSKSNSSNGNDNAERASVGFDSPEESVPSPRLLRRATALSQTLSQSDLRTRLQGDATVFSYYLKMVGMMLFLLFVGLVVIFGFLSNWGSIWLKFWVEDGASGHPKHSTAFYVGLYGMFQALGLTVFFLGCFLCLYTLITVSGTRLHKVALSTVIQAPLRFFTTTDTGLVTNYFSQDMTLIDGELPMALLNTAAAVFLSVGAAAVIATASPYLCITYPFLVALMFVLQKFYLRTSRQLRLLDLEAKSPLYSHFLDTIGGLATYRAFGWVPAGIAVNNRLVDRSQRPAYLLSMIQRWLSFVLQIMVAVIAVLVVALATQLRSNTAFTGASLVALMNFSTTVSYIILSYTQLETSIGAVSRLKTFSETVHPESEPGEDVVPPVSWPGKGEIQLTNVSATYDDMTENDVNEKEKEPQLVLDRLNLTIRAGEKVAICGRTGSGKSSTILLLLRLLNPLPAKDAEAVQPDIVIDGQSLRSVDRAVLRERIIAVPQDAVFLPDGTSFQRNLDPFSEAVDAPTAADVALYRSVLEVVGLWPFVEDRGGLSAGLVADTLSQGQKQLFSLARAMLRGRRRKEAGLPQGVLLLDEVSSSVDQDTDRAMQAAIRDEFSGYTIVMVSHRLDMVVDQCDTVVVLEQGRIIEMGAPKTLVATEGTRFGELWQMQKKE